MSATPSARVAARLRRELGIEVTEEAGRYGEFIVLVDGEPIRRGHPFPTVIGVLPPADEILAAVRERLGR